MLESQELGLMTLGLRLKQASDLLFRQLDELFKTHQIPLSSRTFPVIQLIAANGNISVTRLAQLLGQTHPAVSQLSKKLEAAGWIYHEVDAGDERKRLLALTPKAYELVDNMQPTWDLLGKALEQIMGPSSQLLLDSLSLLERELEKTSLAERVGWLKKQSLINQVEILHYTGAFKDDFYRLNRQWLERYFYVEAIDHDVLSNPEANILNNGGFILIARFGEQVIGTAALIANPEKKLELSKMAVDPDFQGLGVGEKLARAAIDQFDATDFKVLFLESNRKLIPALNLYRKLGFVEKVAPFEKSHYDRADIYMEYEQGF